MTFVSDAVQQVLGCYDMALQDGPNPPPDGNICLRVGEVPFDIGLAQNLCCEGFAWVRVISIFPSTNFPRQNFDPQNCPSASYAIELELGAIRCLPPGDENNGPNCDEWTAVFLQVDEDAASMRRAVCCVNDLIGGPTTFISQVVSGPWTPIDGQGACIGGRMTVTIQVSCSECD